VTTVIRVENLGKKYRIQHQQAERYTALRDVIANRAKSLFRLNPQPSTLNPQPSTLNPHPSEEDFWALKDVNFEIKQGEVVGIIGRNGAGKSTLLKILSRITEPTTGRVSIKGRIASLLEVGTGFHPELTGRENIYLNGAVLGMTRAEVTQKFDEIVAFAEVEQFLDTPVKRYSSGMYMRLAFAVAAHLEPEILVVDEVLAVGDAQFQKKCLGKIREVSSGGGRTVLFVSHNLSAISSLCTQGMLLKNGIKNFFGAVEQTISNYLLDSSNSQHRATFPDKSNQRIQFCYVNASQVGMDAIAEFDCQQPIKVTLGVKFNDITDDIEISVRLTNNLGVPVFTVNRSDGIKESLKKGFAIFDFDIPGYLLPEGQYFFTCGIHKPGEIFDLKEECISFRVHDTCTALAKYAPSATGVILLRTPWTQQDGLTSLMEACS
jgi:lipopolysaccharide transport system ATP-binding protein